MKMALKMMRVTIIATKLKDDDYLYGPDDDDRADDGAVDDGADDEDTVDADDTQEAEGGRLETFLICAGPGSQPTLVKRLTFR